MDLKYQYQTNDISEYTKRLILQRAANQVWRASVMRGSIINVELQNTGAVKVTGSHRPEESTDYKNFVAIFEPKDYNTEFLNGKVLQIQKPPHEKRLVWNTEVCELLKPEFGITLQREDFIRERISGDEIRLTFLPYHPFFKGTVVIKVVDELKSNVASTPETVVKLGSINCAKSRHLFTGLQVGDVLSGYHQIAISQGEGSMGDWVNIETIADKNLFGAQVVVKTEHGVVIELNPNYNRKQYSSLKIII
jgi:hypothetical protein